MSERFDEIAETAEEKAAREKNLRAAEISRRFAEIDRERIRPLAAVVSGGGTDEDRRRLSELEREAASLRKELSEVKQWTAR